jgi:hypothetical protein
MLKGTICIAIYERIVYGVLMKKEARPPGSSCTAFALCQAPGRKARILTLTSRVLQCLLLYGKEAQL